VATSALCEYGSGAPRRRALRGPCAGPAYVLNSHRKETPEKALKEKKSRKNDIDFFVDFLRNFPGKVFFMDLMHFFHRVFLLPSPRNAQKRT
jgi:hypothetical protein